MLDLFIRGKEVYLKYLLRNHFYSKKGPLTYKSKVFPVSSKLFRLLIMAGHPLFDPSKELPHPTSLKATNFHALVLVLISLSDPSTSTQKLPERAVHELLHPLPCSM